MSTTSERIPEESPMSSNTPSGRHIGDQHSNNDAMRETHPRPAKYLVRPPAINRPSTLSACLA